MRNEVRKPTDGTITGKVWEVATGISQNQNATATCLQVRTECDKLNINPATIATQYARWRKFHGITGRVVDEALEAQKAQAKAAEAIAKADAKAKKAEEKAKLKVEADAAKAQAKLEAAEEKARIAKEKEHAKVKAAAAKAVTENTQTAN